MAGHWINSDGWPSDWPDSLEPAIRALDGAAELDPERIAQYARRLAGAADRGRAAEAPSAIDAPVKKTDQSLEKLHDKCAELLEILNKLNRPALKALKEEGFSVGALRNAVANAQEAARHCWGYTDAPLVKKGRNPAVSASLVAQEAADIYREVTGKRPTITRHPVTHKVSGPFFRFLTACYASLYVKASAEAQIASLGLKGEKPPA